jgi:hypothetical protein
MYVFTPLQFIRCAILSGVDLGRPHRQIRQMKAACLDRQEGKTTRQSGNTYRQKAQTGTAHRQAEQTDRQEAQAGRAHCRNDTQAYRQVSTQAGRTP